LNPVFANFIYFTGSTLATFSLCVTSKQISDRRCNNSRNTNNLIKLIRCISPATEIKPSNVKGKIALIQFILNRRVQQAESLNSKFKSVTVYILSIYRLRTPLYSGNISRERKTIVAKKVNSHPIFH